MCLSPAHTVCHEQSVGDFSLGYLTFDEHRPVGLAASQ